MYDERGRFSQTVMFRIVTFIVNIFVRYFRCLLSRKTIFCDMAGFMTKIAHNFLLVVVGSLLCGWLRGWRWFCFLFVEMLVVARALLVSSINVIRASFRINLSRKRGSVCSTALTVFQAEIRALYFEGRIPSILTMMSDKFSSISFSWFAMFSILAICWTIESPDAMRYSWNFVVSVNLLDALFCSWIALSFVHISVAVVHVMRYSSCEYSIEDDMMNIARAFFFRKSSGIFGLTSMPSTIFKRSRQECATKTGFHLKFP